MASQVYWIEDVPRGRLGIMPRPRGGDWLRDELAALRAESVDVLVSLLTAGEEAELCLLDEASDCEKLGLRFMSIPIKDRGTPSVRVVARAIDELTNDLAAGHSVVIHCRIGIGRAAMIAATLLARCGLDINDAFGAIERARGCRVPDTPQQKEWAATYLLAAGLFEL